MLFPMLCVKTLVTVPQRAVLKAEGIEVPPHLATLPKPSFVNPKP